jgi:hypothetical protein
MSVGGASITLEQARFAYASSLSPLPPIDEDLQRQLTEEREVPEALEVGGRVFPSLSLRALSKETRNRLVSQGLQQLQQTIHSAQPQLLSLRYTDATNLAFFNVDLRECRFAEAHNLDKLRIEGERIFPTTPVGWQWKPITTGSPWPPTWRWTRRRTIAEEHIWRAQHYGFFQGSTLSAVMETTNDVRHPGLLPATPRLPQSRSKVLKRRGWLPERDQSPIPELASDLRPAQIAALYRSLRKALEDSRNEPGAADFYYGEMEMRRLDSDSSLAERAILLGHWLLSGYSLRGLRALCWLIAVTLGIALLLHQVGFTTRPSPTSFLGSLIYTAGTTISIGDDSTQLTAWGKLLRIILRLAGPVLLAVAVLSVRNRVKR